MLYELKPKKNYYAMTFQQLSDELQLQTLMKAELEKTGYEYGFDFVTDDLRKLARKRGLLRHLMAQAANPEQLSIINELNAVKAKLTSCMQRLAEIEGMK